MKSGLKILQTRLNIESVLFHYGLEIPVIQMTLIDRCVFLKNFQFITNFELVAKDHFEPWKLGIGKHAKVLGTTAMRGWREKAPWNSMQVIEHYSLIEIDFDRANPGYGILPFVIHGFEWLIPGKTNSFGVKKGLEKRGIKVKDARKAA